MSARYVLISTYLVQEGGHDQVARLLGTSTPSRQTYRAIDGNDVVELQGFDDLADIAALDAAWQDREPGIAPLLLGDVRRHVLRFVEAPKDCASLLPQTEHMQLRYVEVRPPRSADYHAWRKRTIFAVVREAPEVSVFLAYHTLISTQPGVMFVAGFDGPVAPYNAVFTSEQYRDIVQQAGDTYITGGTAGLFTRIYRRIPDAQGMS